jgi:hypothetical protein
MDFDEWLTMDMACVVLVMVVNGSGGASGGGVARLQATTRLTRIAPVVLQTSSSPPLSRLRFIRSESTTDHEVVAVGRKLEASNAGLISLDDHG